MNASIILAKYGKNQKSVLPDKINFKSIPKNLNADTFNIYFVEAPLNLKSKFSKEPGPRLNIRKDVFS